MKYNSIYTALINEYGGKSPRSAGYRSAKLFAKERSLILDIVNDNPCRILDLGCGPGLVSMPLANKGFTVFGVDYNINACKAAVLNGINVIRGNGSLIGFRDDCFDVVLAIEFNQQFPLEQLEFIIQEVSRVIQPGGRLIMVWRNGRALLQIGLRCATRLLNIIKGRKTMKLYHHPLPTVIALCKKYNFIHNKSFTFFPATNALMNYSQGVRSRLWGTNYVAVFRQTA